MDVPTFGLLRSLWWAVRGRRAVGDGDVPLGYADRFTPMLWAIGFLGALEVGVVHLLTARWPVLQWTLFAAGVYGIVWMLGFAFALRQHPHLLQDGGLLLRFGPLRSFRVPLGTVVAVRRGAVSGHRRNLVVEGDSVTLAVMGDTNVELRLDPAVELEVDGAPRTVGRIAFYADDPRAVTGLVRSRV